MNKMYQFNNLNNDREKHRLPYFSEYKSQFFFCVFWLTPVIKKKKGHIFPTNNC